MKRNAAIFLSAAAVLISLAALLWVVGAARAGPAANPALPAAGAPTVVSYQGQVWVDGSPYDGLASFKFAIIDAAGTTTYWSNDGTSTGGGEPTNGVMLPVTNGLFNVLLGDTSLTNMTEPLVPSTFDGTERYLRVWFSADSSTFAQLAPDRRIAAVPYALQAEEAVNADTLDGQDASAFADAIHTHPGSDITSAVSTATLALSTTQAPWSGLTGVPAGFADGVDDEGIVDVQNGEGLTRTASGDTVTLTVAFSGTGAAATAARCDHTHDGLLPSGALVLGRTTSEPTLIAAGFSYTGPILGDTWRTRATMPTGRWGLAAAAVDGVIYAIGGYSGAGSYETVNEAYDPATDSWTTKAPMPTARYGLAAAAVDGVVYTMGGISYVATNETVNEAYDPATDSWTTKAPMPTGRYGLAVAAVDGVVYAIGGMSPASSCETANEAYNPVANSWSTKARMPTGRRLLAAAAVDGVVYAIGGNLPATIYGTVNEAYDPVANSWSTKAPMPTGRYTLAAAAVDGIVYAIGGNSSATSYGTVNEAYDPVANSWSIKTPMPTGRHDLAAAGVDGVVYAIGGWSSAIIYGTVNEAYTPALYVYEKR